MLKIIAELLFPTGLMGCGDAPFAWKLKSRDPNAEDEVEVKDESFEAEKEE